MNEITLQSEKNNNKVPIAVLSCFVIAFILQGLLKIWGIFIFEKALDWEIFNVIDSSKLFNIIYQILINIIAVYCLSFAFTSRPYSKKWYHYLIILVGCSFIITCRMTLKTPFYWEFLYDIALYVVIPIIIDLTTEKQFRMFDKLNVTTIITTIAIHILLYFVYLGLCYWSTLLTSLVVIEQTKVSSSASFLIFFELYIGLILLMMSMNITIKLIKRR